MTVIFYTLEPNLSITGFFSFLVIGLPTTIWVRVFCNMG
jgi:hypothetical protein